MNGMDTCCRCHVTPIPPLDGEDEDALDGAEDQGDPDLPVIEPVPEGWLPDPDSDHGLVCPGCISGQERQQAAEELELVVRHLHGEFDA
jgi:hypothetical protein